MAANRGNATNARLGDLWQLLKFWGRIPLPLPTGAADKDRFKSEIAAAPEAVRAAALQALVRQYGEVKDDLNSTRSRAGGLLAATGVISGVVALTAGFTTLFQVRSWIGYLGLFLTAAVVYCAVATTFLAIRAQQVDFWGQAEVHPNELESTNTYETEYATALYVTWRDNVDRLRNPVGYLRDAQVYFRALVVALGLLVLITIGANLLYPGSARNSSTQSHPPVSRASDVRH